MYVITRTCPIECLAPLLSRTTFAALADGLDGCPATVGQVIELYRQRRLMDIYNISSGRTGEIRHSLIQGGLIEPSSKPATKLDFAREVMTSTGHHASCPDRLRAGNGGAGN
jgi:hypothetical protein